MKILCHTINIYIIQYLLYLQPTLHRFRTNVSIQYRVIKNLRMNLTVLQKLMGVLHNKREINHILEGLILNKMDCLTCARKVCSYLYVNEPL